ncbi:MAG: type II secretion system GspH family protein [Lachnospiraceae bacterium]|nr:type II secretion system GspH family protein [Lachnospiraceae bacterium]
MVKENDRNFFGNHRGFSLVELIIVIAIMAILVGVMAPQLIKYIEKANVSADVQLCDSVHTAITMAMMDPEVLMVNDPTDHSKGQIDFLMDGDSHWVTQVGGPNSVFCDTVKEILGWNVFSSPDQREHMKSQPASASGALMIQATSGGSGFVIWIVHSDVTGKKADYAATDISNLTNEITNNGSN